MKKIFLGVILVFLCVVMFFWYYIEYLDSDESVNNRNNYIILDNLVGKTIDEVNDYAFDNGIKINILYEYSFDVLKNVIISQNVLKGSKIYFDDEVTVVVSMGKISNDIYKENMVNELGSVPIMMYHGIVNISSNDTKYIGGNVDRDGYNRTAEAFREDLEFYYEQGYRMIRLSDYVDGKIDVEMGLSPIILTFDDGNENNFKVLGEKDGELIIDPNCAVGILEEFKKKYPDYGVTATFFVNAGLFSQEEYNEKILKWLVSNGYDVGNHTMSHCDFKKIDTEQVVKEVGGLYKILDDVIHKDYVNIVALPFGSPYSRKHSNYETILNGSYLEVDYRTKAALRVGWKAEVSCFDKDFDPTYLKRIRAYDNNGNDYDIEMNFKLLSNIKYISDGDINTIVVPSDKSSKISNRFDGLRFITY